MAGNGRRPMALTAPSSVPVLQKAGELAISDRPLGLRDARQNEALRSLKATSSFVEKHCRSDVSEEWRKADDKKIAKLRGVLAALREENQDTQLLKRRSEDALVLRDLQETRFAVDQRTEECRTKEKAFEQAQQELRREVEKNRAALSDLRGQIEKHEVKARDERAQGRELDREIEALNSELKDYEAQKEAENRKIAQTSQYKKYLESVVRECEDDFEGDVEILMARHRTLEAGNRELMNTNESLSGRLDKLRDECTRMQNELQNEHLMISSRLHECQVSLDRHRAESQELETRLTKALEEKELKESQVGVVQMAIEQLFLRTVASCGLKQRRKAMHERVDVKFAPLRGDKNDVRLEAMLTQIIERMRELKSILAEVKQDDQGQVRVDHSQRFLEDSDIMDRITFETGNEKVRPNGGTDSGGLSVDRSSATLRPQQSGGVKAAEF